MSLEVPLSQQGAQPGGEEGPCPSDYSYFPPSASPSIAQPNIAPSPPPTTLTPNREPRVAIRIEIPNQSSSSERHKDAMCFVVEVVESQRRFPFLGWSGDRLLPTDRYNFANEKGTIERRREDVDKELPTDHRCSWESDWQIYRGTDECDHYKYIGLNERREHMKKYCRFDEDGWEYALDFPRDYVNTYSSTYHWVRRRFWRRVFLLNAPISYHVPFPANFKAIMHTERVDVKALEAALKEYAEERCVGK